jgi:hypothetical protein
MEVRLPVTRVPREDDGADHGELRPGAQSHGHRQGDREGRAQLQAPHEAQGPRQDRGRRGDLRRDSPARRAPRRSSRPA